MSFYISLHDLGLAPGNTPGNVSELCLAVFEIVLCELMDSRSINELNFGGPALLLVDRRNMQ